MINSEIWGIEWDWFASDLDGSIAFLSSGGSGQVPPVVIADEPLIDELLQVLGIEYNSQSWAKAAECGLFAYDVDVNGGPYRRIAMPDLACTASTLPEKFRAMLLRVVIPGHFTQMEEIDYELLGL